MIDVQNDNTLRLADLGAASPTPGAAYMVSNMSSISRAVLAVMFLTGAAAFTSIGLGYFKISKIAITC